MRVVMAHTTSNEALRPAGQGRCRGRQTERCNRVLILDVHQAATMEWNGMCSEIGESLFSRAKVLIVFRHHQAPKHSFLIA